MDPTQDPRFLAAADFFLSLRKQASVRQDARAQVRALTSTNSFQTPVAKPEVRFRKTSPATPPTENKA